ncbi:isoleucine--tRNA ligase [Candidatus Pacearchaeota archaeon]|nr:isoleucine--tRNA ligase [Candidatus Pacearchaeota archaeon]
MEESKQNTAKQEEEILKFWKDKKIYEKSREKNSKGKKFYMMDGPPYATGHIHMGTALNKILKDIAMRARRLQNYDVFDRAGYDTHGVPIEFQIEKEIGSKSKKDIEKYGVKNFIEKCKEFATKHIDEMNAEFLNLGVWMNFENPYLTLTDDYIETIWDTFKEADKKGLLYLGKYPVHLCPRCETAVAYNEIEYAKQEDTSVFVKFPLKTKKNTFLVIWTTTPWTLPANTGVMVHPEFYYQEIELSSGERWIIAKELVPKIMAELELGFNVKNEFKGKEMEGWEYENPLAKNMKLKVKNGYKVVLSGRYVNLEDGTGLVHTAPGHGKEDYEVGKEYNIDMPSPVAINGELTEETGKYAGKKARVVDEEIIQDLEREGFLVYKKKYSHDYPLCWRCKSPLLMVSQPQWFFKISDIQKKLLEENEETNWLPSWTKSRMKAWLEGVSDWPVSRKRYWGTPLPIWICDKCEDKIVIGSVEELKELAKVKKVGLHKPEIDEIAINCKCGGKIKRVPDVLDVWFDSGVSSWAALKIGDYNKNLKKYWPADLNIEGKDQIRGWWNSQFILSEIKFGRRPFDNIVMHGMVLDLGKKKMSKSVGNIISPKDIIEKYGRDYLRYYFAKISKGDDFSFDEKEFLEIQKVMRVLVNVNNFANQLKKERGKEEVEDKWILSMLNSTIKNVQESYNKFKFYEAVALIEKFLVLDLSRGYIQITRERADETCGIIFNVRECLLKILCPIIPFLTEKIWQELRGEKSVKEESLHLSSWPKEDENKIDLKLEKNFELVFKIIEAGLAERDKAKIGLRWPLAKAKIYCEEKIGAEFNNILKNQLNVKSLEINSGKELKVELDLNMNKELEAEGYARELARNIQSERKKAGLVKEDMIDLIIVGEKEIFSRQEKFIKEKVNARMIFLENEEKKRFKNSNEFNIKEKRIKISFEVHNKI